MRILLVEDDEFTRHLLAEQLREAGFDVVQENNANDAIVLIASESFDLLITDIILPNTDGASLMKHVRSTGKDIKIIAITAGMENAQDDYINYADMFADLTLAKPIKKDDLIAAVKGLVS